MQNLTRTGFIPGMLPVDVIHQLSSEENPCSAKRIFSSQSSWSLQFLHHQQKFSPTKVSLFCVYVCLLVPSTGHSGCYKCLFPSTGAAKSPQSCPTLCDPRDSSPPGSVVPGILQARTLEWVCHYLLQCMKVILQK